MANKSSIFKATINGVPAKIVRVDGDVVTIEAKINPYIVYFKKKQYDRQSTENS